MNEGSTTLQQAISAQRARTTRRLHGWLLLTCGNPTCSAMECNVFLDEADDRRPAQAPMLCPRCREELAYEGFEPERDERTRS
jgi:hypothetical protein